MSVLNFAVRQCLLEFLHTRVGDVGVLEAQFWSWVNPLRCCSPASLTLVSWRSSRWSWVNPLRCCSPASLTWLP